MVSFTIAREINMRPVIIGAFVFISAALYAASSAAAFQSGGHVSGQSGTGSKGDAALGAPLYAGDPM